jgi:TolB-like protein
MKTTTTRSLAVCVGLAFVAAWGSSARADDGRTLVFVSSFSTTDKSLAQNADAMTSSFCAQLSKNPRLDVICAPDVKQILEFAANASLMGSNNNGATKVTERLDRVQQIVSGTLRREGNQMVLVVKAGPRAKESEGLTLFSDKAVVGLEERSDKAKALLDRLPAVATRVGDAVSPKKAPPPPAPLPAAPAPAASSGW